MYFATPPHMCASVSPPPPTTVTTITWGTHTVTIQVIREACSKGGSDGPADLAGLIGPQSASHPHGPPHPPPMEGTEDMREQANDT